MKGFLEAFPTDYDDCIMNHLDPKSLYRLAWTCTELHIRANSYLARTMSIERLLGRVFLPHKWDKFRYLQLRTGLVITGSTALHFLTRSSKSGWSSRHMDLYVEHPYARTVIGWLDEVGFRYNIPKRFPQLKTAVLALELRNDHFGYGKYHTIGSTLNFTRGRATIRIFTTKESIMKCVLNFHNTGVMNIISYNKAYCLYPNATLVHNTILINNNLSMSLTRVAAVKYHLQGWNIVYSIPQSWQSMSEYMQDKYIDMLNNNNPPTDYEIMTNNKTDNHSVILPDPRYIFPFGIRRVGDNKCWTYTLPPMDAFIVSDISPLETNTWIMIYDRNRMMTMRTYKLIGGNLDYSYTVATSLLHKKIKARCKTCVERIIRDKHLHSIVVEELRSELKDRFWDNFLDQDLRPGL